MIVYGPFRTGLQKWILGNDNVASEAIDCFKWIRLAIAYLTEQALLCEIPLKEGILEHFETFYPDSLPLAELVQVKEQRIIGIYVSIPVVPRLLGF